MPFLSVLVTIKNESSILKEWIEHYFWQGVDHIYIIDNGSTDDFREIISPYSDRITVFTYPEPYKRVDHYNLVFDQIKNDTKWLLACDVTQYCYVSDRVKVLKDYIEEQDQQGFDCIYVRCKPFTSTEILLQQPESIRESFTSLCSSNTIYKAIAKSEKISRLGIWKHVMKSGTKSRTEFKHIYINDYVKMSLEYFINNKLHRTNPDNPDIKIGWYSYYYINGFMEDLDLKMLLQGEEPELTIKQKEEYFLDNGLQIIS